MPAEVFEFDRPDRFIVGTVGEPGSRTFYLQAKGRTTDSSPDRVTSVALEKQQVSVLAERVDELLDEVSRRSSDTPSADPRSLVQPAAPTDLDPLELPLEEDFRVGTMSLGWDAERFDVYRCRMEYPVLPSTVAIFFDLTDAPAG